MGLTCFLLAGHAAAQSRPEPEWTTAIQTGMADTFQLTLGGMFGEGPAWQNRLTTGIVNGFRAGDSLSIYAWDTFDTSDYSHNWQGGIGYRAPVWKRGNHLLVLGSGYQYWRFPSVKTGTNDRLIPGNLLFQTRISRIPVTVTSDSWTLLSSPLPTGSLLHTQVWLPYRLVNRPGLKIDFKHGPAHTYSWNFYGTNGNRIFRYQTMLCITTKGVTIEGGYRKQWGLQPGIQPNNFWQFSVTRAFATPIHPRDEREH